MKIYLLLAIILLQNIYGCSQNAGTDINVMPKNFKIIIPFEINKRGIIINTYWGAGKIKNELLWDNNSPTWANEEVISNNKSISISKKYFYATTTANGTSIHGNIYNCDSISLDQVTFMNVPFYKIADKMKGVFGENLISKGVWEINFKKQEMIFTSSIDSLPDFNKAELFPSSFTNDVITIPVSFRNNITENVELDFGFNDGIVLPNSDFLKISKGCDRIYKRELQLSTPGNKSLVETTNALDTIQIQGNMFETVITTDKLSQEKLIGRGFFETFEFVIFDYKNKLFYVSKNKHQ